MTGHRPALVDDFRVSCEPDPTCDVCGALAKQRRDALRSGDMDSASSRAREIRECDHSKREL